MSARSNRLRGLLCQIKHDLGASFHCWEKQSGGWIAMVRHGDGVVPGAEVVVTPVKHEADLNVPFEVRILRRDLLEFLPPG